METLREARINGKPAVIAFLTIDKAGGFEPATSEDDIDVYKVIFEDGTSAFLTDLKGLDIKYVDPLKEQT